MSKDKIILNSNNLINIYGPRNETINLIKSHFVDLKITPRGVEIILEGCDSDIKQAKKIFTKLINYTEKSNSLIKEDVQKILVKGRQNDQKRVHSSFVLVRKNGSQIQSRNRGQQNMINLSLLNKLLFALGPAGTGKTYMAIALASNALKEQHVKKIILTRPAVEAGENLGFLPGDLYDKLSPYMKPLYDSLYDIFEKEKLNFYLKKLKLNQIPFLNCKLLENGSDAHYTSSLYNFNINKKKILNEKCELNDFKNVHVMDGSVIKEGLYYPTLFLMMYIKHISKLIINNDKKN